MKRDLLPFQVVMGVVSASIAGIIAVLGELRSELGFSETGIGIIVASGFLASFFAQVGFARFADRGYGRRLATIGIAISAIALFAMVIADTVVVWSLSRAALGFAGGLVLPGLRRAATVLDPENVGENLGRLIVGEIGGFVLGPIVASALVEVGGLRAPFLAFAVLSVLFLPFVARLPDDNGAHDETAGFPFDLLKNQRLQAGLILIFGYFFLIGAFESVLPVMLEDEGARPTTVGLAFTVFAVPIVIVSARAGRTADRVGPPRVAIAGMAISAAATATYGVIPNVSILIVLMTVVGFADGYGFIAGQVLISRSVDESRQAGALGLMGAFEVLGAAISAIPAAWLYGQYGKGLTWLLVATSALIFLTIGAIRLRGTEPVNASGADLDWTPVDRHPSPRVEDVERPEFGRWQSVDIAAYDVKWKEIEKSGQNPHGEADFVSRFSPQSVLDAGCGSGRVAIELAARGCDVVGVDLDRPFIEAARRKAPNLDFRLADLATVDVGRRFDVVVMAGNVMIFVAPGTEAEVVRRMAAHVAPGGRLIAGFQLRRGLTVAQYNDAALSAGLVIEEHWSTWDGEPVSEADRYATVVHRAPE